AWTPDPNPTLVGDGIARFRDPHDGDAPLAPSLALVREPHVTGPVPADFRARPLFARRDGSRIARIDCPRGTSLYGTGEVPGPLLRNGRRTVCWNTDSFEY